MDQFKVFKTHEEANKHADIKVYRWSERMSAKTGEYVFVKRKG